jgi:hypothetical protein
MPENDTTITAGHIVLFRQHVRLDPVYQSPHHLDGRCFASDPYWRDLILFNEYFHGDTGRGCGASHQTGWTGLVAPLAWIYTHRTDLDRMRDIRHLYSDPSAALVESSA